MVTDFQKLVWAKLEEIPQGRITSYKELARAVGKSRAVRAVGSACASNPNLIEVPCHRVVRSDGKVGSYRGGYKTKIALLEKEGISIDQNGCVANFSNCFHHFDS
ncbi:MAG: methylated-DNA--[protein]-cysteine S-methyltransferase [Patescibacteria group bacterium]